MVGSYRLTIAVVRSTEVCSRSVNGVASSLAGLRQFGRVILRVTSLQFEVGRVIRVTLSAEYLCRAQQGFTASDQTLVISLPSERISISDEAENGDRNRPRLANHALPIHHTKQQLFSVLMRLEQS